MAHESLPWCSTRSMGDSSVCYEAMVDKDVSQGHVARRRHSACMCRPTMRIRQSADDLQAPAMKFQWMQS